MNEIVASLIVFAVAYVTGEEFGASLLAVLPYLFDGHVVCINMVNDTAGEIIFCFQIMFLLLGAPVAIVKAHDIAVWKYHAGMLLILPVEFVPDWLKEVFLHILRPSRRISDDPVQPASLKIPVDDDILMASGKCQGIRLFIVPYRIIMEPVVGILTSGTAGRVHRKHILMIPLF